MKKLVILCFVFVFSIVLLCSVKTIEGQIAHKQSTMKKDLSLKSQLETFKKLGFELNEGVTFADINRWDNDGKKFEKEPYFLLYITLGQAIEREPWTPLTDRCWHFDTEAIEAHGDYVKILKNLERISRGEIKFKNLKDYVDIEEEKAWLSFEFKGKKYKWDLKVDNDWVDTDLFVNVENLTEQTKGKFTYLFTGGQDVVIGFETPKKMNEIIKATGLKIKRPN